MWALGDIRLMSGKKGSLSSFLEEQGTFLKHKTPAYTQAFDTFSLREVP